MRVATFLRSSTALALALIIAPRQFVGPMVPPPRSAVSMYSRSVGVSANSPDSTPSGQAFPPARVILAQYIKPQIGQYVEPISRRDQPGADRSAEWELRAIPAVWVGREAAESPATATSGDALVHLVDASPQSLTNSLGAGSAPAAGTGAAPPPPSSQPLTNQPREATITPTYSPQKEGAAAASKPLFGGVGIVQGGGRLITLPAPVANVFVADPTIAAVRPASPDKLFVFGKTPGITTLVATDAHGNTVARLTISVSPSRYGAVRIESASRKVSPGSDVRVTPETGGVVVRGTVNTPAEDYKLMQEAKISAGKAGKVINETEVVEPQQVAVKVRIASMARTVTQQLGINWQTIGNGISIGKFLFNFSTVGNLIASAASTTGAATAPLAGSYTTTFPGNNLDAILNALDTDNLAHILAEPTLTALSGQTASFIDGGSFPVPVPGQNGTVTVEYQNYGVQLQFKPVVLNDGDIALSVSPTVSSPSTQNAFQINVAGESLVVPSLVEQAASTTVVMGSGQTLAIAGLLYNTSNQTDTAVPGLGQIPVLGSAFRSDSYERQQQELVVLVTPYIVQPVNNANKLHTPIDHWRPPNQLQRIFLFQNNGSTRVQATIPGQAGFMVR